MANIGSLVVSLQARTESLEKQLNRANGLIKKLQAETKGIGTASERAEKRTVRAFTRMGVGARGLSTSLVAVSRNMKLLAAGGAAFLAGSFVNRTIEATDEVGKFADRVGIAVEDLQTLQIAAERSGVQLNVFQLGLQRILRRAQEAVEGNNQLADAFNNVGLSLVDLETLGAADIFRQAIVGAAELENGLVAIQKIADTEGVALINLGRQGAAGIAALENRARSLGQVLDENLVRKSEAANDALRDVALIIGTRLKTVALELAPVLERIGLSFAKIVQGVSETTTRLEEFSRGEQSVIKFLQGLKNLFEATLPLLEKAGKIIMPILNKVLEIAAFSLKKVNQAVDAATRAITGNTTAVEKNVSALQKRQRIVVDINRGSSTRTQRQAFPTPDPGGITETTRSFVAYETALRKIASSNTVRLVEAGFEGLSSAISNAAIGIAQGTQSISEAIRNMAQSIVASLLSSAINQALSQLQQLAIGAIVGGVSAGAGAAATPAPVPVGATGAVGRGVPAANNVTVINVANQEQAQRIAALEQAQGRSVSIQGLSQQVRTEGNGNVLVQSLRETMRR